MPRVSDKNIGATIKKLMFVECDHVRITSKVNPSIAPRDTIDITVVRDNRYLWA
jgi:hypothetical protein